MKRLWTCLKGRFSDDSRQLYHLARGVALAVTIAACGGIPLPSVVAQELSGGRGGDERSSSATRHTAARRAPVPFYDLVAIKADPAYYRRADAARLYQKAPVPAGQVKHEEILIVGDPFRLALPNSWLEQPLQVRVKPGRPVTFVALDSGTFENGKTTITVPADETGLAAARFHVTNQGYYRVLAGSPENTGPAKFSLRCLAKELREDIVSGRYAQQYLAKKLSQNIQSPVPQQGTGEFDEAEIIR